MKKQNTYVSFCVFLSAEKAQAQCSFPITPTITNTSCNAGSNGSAVLGLGGTAPYTFLWSNGNSSRDLVNFFPAVELFIILSISAGIPFQ